MKITVAGNGKLAGELLRELPGKSLGTVTAWADAPEEGSIVVHAGSGRELADITAYCEKTGSPLVELSTGSEAAGYGGRFPVVLCANTNILILKFLAMLAAGGKHFKNAKVTVTESHQADKSSVPGTAVKMAQSLGVPDAEIRSIRDPQVQRDILKIPAESLSRHAFHRIEIEDGGGGIVLETRVFGPAPYAEGLARILAAIRANKLENRLYDIMEFVENGWI